MFVTVWSRAGAVACRQDRPIILCYSSSASFPDSARDADVRSVPKEGPGVSAACERVPRSSLARGLAEDGGPMGPTGHKGRKEAEEA
jgi:hypothetical protein